MYKIFMQGIISKDIISIFNKGLKRKYNKELSLDFFCLYSDYEIPIGSGFNYFCSLNTGLTINLNAKLIDVTQQWLVPFDRIPMGSRTVARVEFDNNNSIDMIKREMPIKDVWDGAKYDFVLIE